MSLITIDAIDAELPQTQCGKCGHPGCRPYAEAIAAGEAINKCPPGGEATVDALARLLGRPAQPLELAPETPKLAVIREDECIGCVKCLRACPVDAIIGAAKKMHTVIESECTGCELCIEPCPVDCIDLIPHPDWERARNEDERQTYLDRRARLGRQRFHARNARLARQRAEKDARRRERMNRRNSSASATDTSTAPIEQPTTATTPSQPVRTGRASRAARAATQAGIRRLERQLVQARDQDTDDAPIAAELERARQQLADIDAQRSASSTTAQHTSSTARESAEQPPTRTDTAMLNRLRMAVTAADDACRRARRQLQHAELKGTEADQSTALATLEEARTMQQQTRDALRRALPDNP